MKAMKFIILHESKKKMRIHIPRVRMTLREADILEYYIKSLPGIGEAVVSDRTCNAVITFEDGTASGKTRLEKALECFDFQDEEILVLVPEETGRAMNRMYEEKMVCKVAGRMMRKMFLPVPLATAWCIAKSVPYVFHAVKSLLCGKIEVAVLDGTAIGASILRGDFDTASSVMFMLELGDILEEWTRKKSVGDLARAMSLNIDQVWLKTPEGECLVKVDQVQAGDWIVVRNSTIIPLDGRVLEGEMTVNQSTMTGESEPVLKSAGGYVYAGTVVEEGECIIEVTKESGRGKYDQIVRMIEESEKLKSSTETKAYQLADGLVPYSFAGAVLTYLFTQNVTKALSFLMVDYSCAMKLSMPLSVLVAIREAGDHKISVKGGKFMEAVAEADTIVFDKTGTLTYATPKLVKVITFEGRDEDEMLRIAACLEEHYPHSVANAIVKGAEERQLFHEELHSKVEYIVAHGVSSQIGGKKAVIGSYHFVMEDEGSVLPVEEADRLSEIPDEYSRIYLAIGGRLAAVLCIFDPVREEAKSVIDTLHALGIQKICMMTGDNKKTAEAVARTLALDAYFAEALPEDKAQFIRREHEEGRRVMMIGDGVNDTPALSEADVGIAISDGAAIAREIADITIASDSLRAVVDLRRLSTGLMKRIHRNYRFILSFNTALIGLGLAGVITPSMSALLHNASTIITGAKSMTNVLEE